MRSKTQHRPKIVLFGHFGADNFGNDGTLTAALSNIRRLAPDAQLLCVTTFPEKVTEEHRIDALQVSEVVIKKWNFSNPVTTLARRLVVGVPSELYRLVKAVATLRNSQIFMVAGTGLLNDSFCLGGWGPYSVLKWTLAAKICGCRIFFVSTGAGPLERRVSRFLVRIALSLADFRSYRDESTLNYIRSIGFRAADDRVYPDLVFSLPSESLPKPSVPTERNRSVGLGLMTLDGMYGSHKPTGLQYSVYLEALLAFSEWLIARDYKIRLLIGDACDEAAIDRFRTLLKARAVPQEFVIDEPIGSTGELLSQMSGVEFVVATRFHNVLLGLFLNKPTLSISFHHKCSSLMSHMGLSEYCLDIQCLSTERLVSEFCRMEQDAPRLKQVILEKVEEYRRILDFQYGQLFADLGSHRFFASQPDPAIPEGQ